MLRCGVHFYQWPGCVFVYPTVEVPGWVHQLKEPSEEFGLPDALCTNTVLHVILCNMNKSLIYHKGVPQMCVHSVTCQQTLNPNYMMTESKSDGLFSSRLFFFFLTVPCKPDARRVRVICTPTHCKTSFKNYWKGLCGHNSWYACISNALTGRCCCGLLETDSDICVEYCLVSPIEGGGDSAEEWGEGI